MVAEHPTRSFSQFVQDCLYGPGGFYTGSSGAGRGRDFLTSPELTPLFGEVVARAVDTEWGRCGRPGSFTVVEAGAGRGALASSLFGARPGCLPALRYLGVEVSARLREELAGLGVSTAADLPSEPFVGMVIANELLDNLPFDLFERSAEGWSEVRVADEAEVLAPASLDDVRELSELLGGIDVAVGARVPLERGAQAWLARALEVVERGRVLCIDYAATTAEMALRPQHTWLRTYRRHGAGGHPLERPGSQDITVEVAADQLSRIRALTTDRNQAEWLRAHGLDALVEHHRWVWQGGAASPDLAALTSRSRVSEAAALTDSGGLGAFRVLEWEIR